MNDQQCIGIIRFGLEMNSFKKTYISIKTALIVVISQPLYEKSIFFAEMLTCNCISQVPGCFIPTGSCPLCVITSTLSLS